MSRIGKRENMKRVFSITEKLADVSAQMCTKVVATKNVSLICLQDNRKELQ